MSKVTNTEVYEFCREMKFSPLPSEIIASRLKSIPDVKNMFPDECGSPISTTILSDTETNKGADVIVKHIRKKNKIMILADYDADGVSSGAIARLALVNYAKMDPDDVIVLSNNRINGYGVNSTLAMEAMDIRDRDSKFKLIIVVDMGSPDEARYKILKENGFDIVVTDHHLLPKTGRPNYISAFVNPQEDICTLSNKFSGGTVIYYVMMSVMNKLGLEDITMPDLKTMQATTVISDMMDMRDPYNRLSFTEGCSAFKKNKLPVYKAFKETLRLYNGIDEGTAGFVIGPMLNAAGRMGDAYLAVKTLMSNDITSAIDNVTRLVKVNNKRKELQNRMFSIAKIQAISHHKSYNYSTVLNLPDSHGIGGIIASMVGGIHLKPIMCISPVGNVLKGSGRAMIPDFHLFNVLHRINDEDDTVLLKFGGHAAACGIALKSDKLEDFKLLFDKYSKIETERVGGTYVVPIDITASTIDISLSDIKSLLEIAPFGNNWKSPTIKLTNVKSHECNMVGLNNAHMTMKIRTEDGILSSIYFSPKPETVILATSGVKINIYGTIQVSHISKYISITIDKIEKVL